MIDASRKLYIDSNVFILAVEATPDLSGSLQMMFELLKAHPDRSVTSELTIAEGLAKAGVAHRRAYLSLIVWNRIVDLWPVSREILFETVDYRKSQECRNCRMPSTLSRPSRLDARSSFLQTND